MQIEIWISKFIKLILYIFKKKKNTQRLSPRHNNKIVKNKKRILKNSKEKNSLLTYK